jgi:hypothetical protein
MSRTRLSPRPPAHRAGWLGTVVAALALAAPSLAQTWNEVGPVSISNGQNFNIEGPGSVSGAIRSIVSVPGVGGATTIYAGTVNGGIWKTINGQVASPTWTPLTDGLPSLSVSDIQLDPTDPASNTLVATFRSTSAFAGTGGPNAGVYRTTNGGTSWTAINGTGQTQLGVMTNAVVARGNLVLTSSETLGVCQSTNGGASYTRISNGLPTQSTFALVGDASVSTSGGELFVGGTKGIFESTNGGTSWTNVNSAAMTNIVNAAPGVGNVRIALGPGSGNTQTVFASLIDGTGELAGLFRSTNGGAAWTSLDVTSGGATLYNNGQGMVHASLVADPNNSNICYIGGDGVFPAPFTAQIFRVDASKASGSQASFLVNAYDSSGSGTVTSSDTPDQTTPHADTRSMTFDNNSNLLMSGDGGIYRRTGTNLSGAGGATIGPNSGSWSSISGNLRVTEVYAVGYDRITHSVLAATQDNGTLVMQPGKTVSTPLSTQAWTQVFSGDGGGAAVDSLVPGLGTTATNSFRYVSNPFFGNTGFPSSPARSRLTFDAGNNLTASVVFNPTVANGGGALIDTYVMNQGDSYTALSPQATNAVEGGRFYLGTRNRVFESTNATTANPTLTDISPVSGGVVSNLSGAVTAIAAGGMFNGSAVPNAMYVGGGPALYARSSTATALSPVTLVPQYASQTFSMPVRGLSMDTRDWHNVYVVGPAQIFQGVQSTDLSSSNWTEFTGNLDTVAQNAVGSVNLTAIDFVPVHGQSTVGAIIAGSDHGAFWSLTSDATHSWQPFGSSFPNAYVTSFTYDAMDDVLVAATLGRGVLTFPNASFAFVPVPEPAHALLLCAAAGLATLRWAKRRDSATSLA